MGNNSQLNYNLNKQLTKIYTVPKTPLHVCNKSLFFTKETIEEYFMKQELELCKIALVLIIIMALFSIVLFFQ